MSLKVNFYDNVDDCLLKFAVIVARHNGKWVFCKHKDRFTYECPGGHREKGEPISEPARRELWEETGAINFNIQPICVYSVLDSFSETFGMLYYADILKFEKLPKIEIESIALFENMPTNWTYPLIQPLLIKRVNENM